MKILFCIVFFSLVITSKGQYAYNNSTITKQAISQTNVFNQTNYSIYKGRKLFQRNTGIILGLQKGRNTAIELGGEAHWRKISFSKPHIIGATTNMEYDFNNNVIGYKAGIWWKRGRINFTYGGNVSYYSDFDGGNRVGIGPSVGFRLLGFHLVNGYTFLTKNNSAKESSMEVNTLYLSLRYYFPVENKFTWDRKTMKKKRERRKEKEKRKKDREKRREASNDDPDNKGLKKLFNFKKNKD